MVLLCARKERVVGFPIVLENGQSMRWREVVAGSWGRSPHSIGHQIYNVKIEPFGFWTFPYNVNPGMVYLPTTASAIAPNRPSMSVQNVVQRPNNNSGLFYGVGYNPLTRFMQNLHSRDQLRRIILVGHG